MNNTRHHYNVSKEITPKWGVWGDWGVYMKSPHFGVFLQRILYYSPISSMVIGYPHTPPILVIIRGEDGISDV